MNKPGDSRRPAVTVPKKRVMTDYYSTSRRSVTPSRNTTNGGNSQRTINAKSNSSPRPNVYSRGSKPMKYGRAGFQLRSNNVITNVYSKLVKNQVMPLYIDLYLQKWFRERNGVEEEVSSETSDDSDSD